MSQKQVYAVFYFGWPSQGLKGVATSHDKALDMIDLLVERGEAARGVRYDSQMFSVGEVPQNAVEIGGVVFPVRESVAV